MPKTDQREAFVEQVRRVQVSRRRFLYLSALGAAGLAAGCAPSAPPPAPTQPPAAPTQPPAAKPAVAAPTPAPRELRPVKILFGGSVPTAMNSNAWVGLHPVLDYFKEEGLEPTFEFTSGGARVAQAVAAGTADIGSTTLDFALEAATKGEDLGLVGYYLYIRKFVYQLAVNPGSPIKDVKELKGKKIGVIQFGNPGHVYAENAIRAVGIAKDDVAFINTGAYAPAGVALQKGEVDALSMSDNEFGQIQNTGIPIRMIPDPPGVGEIFGQSIVTKRDFLKTKRDLAVAVGRAIAKGTVFFIENPEATLRLHWKLFPEAKPKGMSDAEALQNDLRLARVRVPNIDIAGNAKAAKWGYHPPESWPIYLKYLGLEEKIKDPNPFYTNDLIDDINKFDVEKVRQQAKTVRVD